MEERFSFRLIFTAWMQFVTQAVKAEAIRLVSGPLLHISTGTLVRSFFHSVREGGRFGIVGNTAPHALIWELRGVRGPIKGPILIVKRGVGGGRTSKGSIVRQETYTKTREKRPVRFLKTALETEMTGSRGDSNYHKLGNSVALAMAERYVNMIARRFGSGAVVVHGARLSFPV